MKHNQKIGHWVKILRPPFESARLRVQSATRTPYGEIDIIAKQGDVTIFVEVKTLTSSRNFFPEQNVTAKKREHMLACAQHYAAEHAIDHWQIDVIAVEGKQGVKPTVTHFENAIT
jgi:putative endonuclease